MCGLVALVSKKRNGFSREQEVIFSELLYLDYLRGNDSTGVFLVQNNGDVMVAKEASRAVDFLETSEYKQVLNRAWSRGAALIGHNRKATRGNVNDANAHPFVVDDNIVLVHNGTMFSDHKKLADVEVDSHAIAHTIHEKKGDVSAALSSFDAAFALIWFDFENGVLNMVRNTQRPLHWIETENEWVYASEAAMLNFVAERNKLKITDGPKELKEHVLQKFTLNRGSGWTPAWETLDIKRKVLYNSGPINGQWLGNGNAHYTPPSRRQQLANAWGYDDDNDFDDVPAFGRDNVVALPPPVLSKNLTDDLNDSRTHRPLTGTNEREREIAVGTGRIIPNGQFQNIVRNQFIWGKNAVCVAFDYQETVENKVNGYYLYLYSVEDSDIIIRLFMSKAQVSEERMVQIAGSGYVYRVRCVYKCWSSTVKLENRAPVESDPGYVIVDADRQELIHGGAMVNEYWKKKLNETTLH